MTQDIHSCATTIFIPYYCSASQNHPPQEKEGSAISSATRSTYVRIKAGGRGVGEVKGAQEQTCGDRYKGNTGAWVASGLTFLPVGTSTNCVRGVTNVDVLSLHPGIQCPSLPLRTHICPPCTAPPLVSKYDPQYLFQFSTPSLLAGATPTATVSCR